ncbi:MAG: hypothetical protein ACREJB_05205, partial [Planctomycetaceae bacterium]
IQIRLDKTALEEDGILLDEPITIALKNVTLETLLERMLEPLGVTALVDRGTLLITTKLAAEDELLITLYNARDVIEEDDPSALVATLQQETSGPWIDTDGTGGTIGIPMPGILAIRQTEEVHEEIQSLLAAIRRMRDQTGAAKRRPDPNEFVTRFYPVLDEKTATDAIAAIQEMIAPETWKGGDRVIRQVGPTIIVKHTRSVQDEVKEFLDKLEISTQALQPGFMGGGGGFGGGGLGGGGGGFFNVK